MSNRRSADMPVVVYRAERLIRFNSSAAPADHQRPLLTAARLGCRLSMNTRSTGHYGSNNRDISIRRSTLYQLHDRTDQNQGTRSVRSKRKPTQATARRSRAQGPRASGEVGKGTDRATAVGVWPELNTVPPAKSPGGLILLANSSGPSAARGKRIVLAYSQR